MGSLRGALYRTPPILIPTVGWGRQSGPLLFDVIALPPGGLGIPPRLLSMVTKGHFVEYRRLARASARVVALFARSCGSLASCGPRERVVAGVANKARRRRVLAAVSAGAIGLRGGGARRQCTVEGPGAGRQGRRASARSPPPPVSTRAWHRWPGLKVFWRPAPRGAASARWLCRSIKSALAWRATSLSHSKDAGLLPCSGRTTHQSSCRC